MALLEAPWNRGAIEDAGRATGQAGAYRAPGSGWRCRALPSLFVFDGAGTPWGAALRATSDFHLVGAVHEPKGWPPLAHAWSFSPSTLSGAPRKLPKDLPPLSPGAGSSNARWRPLSGYSGSQVRQRVQAVARTGKGLASLPIEQDLSVIARELPLRRRGDTLVVVPLKLEGPLGQFEGWEVVGCERLALDNGEVDFGLVKL